MNNNSNSNIINNNNNNSNIINNDNDTPDARARKFAAVHAAQEDRQPTVRAVP